MNERFSVKDDIWTVWEENRMLVKEWMLADVSKRKLYLFMNAIDWKHVVIVVANAFQIPNQEDKSVN